MIREFEDDTGRLWDVVAGRESWGTIVAIFVPVDASESPRQTPIQAEGYEEGYAELKRWTKATFDAFLNARSPCRWTDPFRKGTP
jgi:hypothetical protein